MKKNRTLKLGLLALALVLVTTSIMSSTLAKYATSFDGTGTVYVAGWKAILKDGENAQGTEPAGTESVNLDLFKTIVGNNDVIGGDRKIAPGTSGSFKLTYNTENSEVDHKVTIAIEKMNGTIPKNMVFNVVKDAYIQGPTRFNLNDDNAEVTFSEEILAARDGSEGTLTINWVWPIGNTDAAIIQDTADGINLGWTNNPITLKTTFTAIQLNPDPGAGV